MATTLNQAGLGNVRTELLAGLAAAYGFIARFDFKEAVEHVQIDLSQGHFWDITAVKALDKVVMKFRREGTRVDVVGMNTATRTVVDRFGVYDKPDEVEKLMGGH